MAELKFTVSDDLAAKLKPFEGQLEEILEIGFREFEPKQSILYEEILEFFSNGPSVAEIIEIKPSQSANDRVLELTQKNKMGELSNKEAAELDLYQEINHLMTLVKLRARQNLDSR